MAEKAGKHSLRELPSGVRDAILNIINVFNWLSQTSASSPVEKNPEQKKSVPLKNVGVFLPGGS